MTNTMKLKVQELLSLIDDSNDRLRAIRLINEIVSAGYDELAERVK